MTFSVKLRDATLEADTAASARRKLRDYLRARGAPVLRWSACNRRRDGRKISRATVTEASTRFHSAGRWAGYVERNSLGWRAVECLSGIHRRDMGTWSSQDAARLALEVKVARAWEEETTTGSRAV